MNLTSEEIQVLAFVITAFSFCGAVFGQLITPLFLSIAKFTTRFMSLPKSHYLMIEQLNDEIAFLRESLIAKESQIKVLTSDDSL